jgi:hypothetical protein
VIFAQIDEDAVPAWDQVTPTTATVRELKGVEHDSYVIDDSSPTPPSKPAKAAESSFSTKQSTAPRKRPFANLPRLPEDVAAAFEQFKLAILTHKMAGWTEISRDDLLAALDALKELLLQPAEG